MAIEGVCLLSCSSKTGHVNPGNMDKRGQAMRYIKHLALEARAANRVVFDSTAHRAIK